MFQPEFIDGCKEQPLAGAVLWGVLAALPDAQVSPKGHQALLAQQLQLPVGKLGFPWFCWRLPSRVWGGRELQAGSGVLGCAGAFGELVFVQLQ